MARWRCIVRGKFRAGVKGCSEMTHSETNSDAGKTHSKCERSPKFHTLITWLRLHLHASNIQKHNFVFPNSMSTPSTGSKYFTKSQLISTQNIIESNPFISSIISVIPRRNSTSTSKHTIHSFDSVIHQPWNKKCWQRHEWTYWLIMCDCSCSLVCVISVRWSGEINMISRIGA